MTGQDVALLLTLQLAILTAAALTAWTVYHVGYDRGRQAGDPFTPLQRAMRQTAKALQLMAASIRPPRLRIPDEYAERARRHYAAQVRDPMAHSTLTNITEV